MKRAFVTLAAVAAFMGVTSGISLAANPNDWTGIVKGQATYLFTTGEPVDVTVDATYDYGTPGWGGKAWGTMVYMRGNEGPFTKLTIYMHVICVNRFAGGKYSVVGAVDKAVGVATVPPFYSFEFDTVAQKTGSVGSSTLSSARVSCGNQSGSWTGSFDHGYLFAH